MKAYVTLLDIHPYMMARNLLFFMMIDALVQDKLEAIDRLEVQAAMVYIYIGWIVPSYCEKRFLFLPHFTKRYIHPLSSGS